METQPGFSLTHEERVALTFIAHNDPRDGFVRRTWLEFKTAICGLLQRTRAGGWIPVSERLPEAGVGVLIWSPIDSQCRRARVAAMDMVNGQHLWTSEYGDEMPTHWMPLPEPPGQ